MIHTLQLAQLGRQFAPTDPLFDKVMLRMDFESGEDGTTTFVDQSRKKRTASAAGNAAIDKAFAKFGSRSGIFDGATDAVTFSDSADFTLGTGDWCFECWVYFRVLTGQQFFAGQSDSGGANSTISFLIRKDNTTDKITALCCSGSTVIATLTSSAAVTSGTWYHVALQRTGSSFALHINGTLEASASNASSINDSANQLAIGRLGEVVTSTLDGNVDDVRFTVGATRYPIGANFTVPNVSHPIR